MSAAAVVSVSRPKVHRLPSLPKRRKPHLSFARKLWLWGVLLLAAGVLSMLVRFQPASSSRDTAGGSAGFLPPVADAQAAPVNRSGGTIILRGQSEAIVGQLAKVPAEDEQITEIRAVSDIDNDTRRELLSIISKH